MFINATQSSKVQTHPRWKTCLLGYPASTSVQDLLIFPVDLASAYSSYKEHNSFKKFTQAACRYILWWVQKHNAHCTSTAKPSLCTPGQAQSQDGFHQIPKWISLQPPWTSKRLPSSQHMYFKDVKILPQNLSDIGIRNWKGEKKKKGVLEWDIRR